MEPKRYYRNPNGRMIGGVCTGLADYFDLDISLIRVLFVILAFAGGVGILLYLILLIVAPEKPIDLTQFDNLKTATMENQNPGTENKYNPGPPVNDPYRNNPGYNRNRGNLIGGLVLITLGILFLADEFIPNIRFGDLWPLILVVIGVGLLINSISGRNRKNDI